MVKCFVSSTTRVERREGGREKDGEQKRSEEHCLYSRLGNRGRERERARARTSKRVNWRHCTVGSQKSFHFITSQHRWLAPAAITATH